MLKKVEMKIPELLRYIEKNKITIEDNMDLPDQLGCHKTIENFILDVPFSAFGVMSQRGHGTILSKEINALIYYANRNLNLRSHLLTKNKPLDYLQVDNDVRGKFDNTTIHLFYFTQSISNQAIYEHFDKRFTIDEIQSFKER